MSELTVSGEKSHTLRYDMLIRHLPRQLCSAIDQICNSRSCLRNGSAGDSVRYSKTAMLRVVRPFTDA
jgi:hypothetical protein